MPFEYRVRWEREGREPAYRIYQTATAANRKARGIVALEAVKQDTALADLPDIISQPVVQRRDVGAWETSSQQPDAPSEGDKAGIRDHFRVYEDDPNGPF